MKKIITLLFCAGAFATSFAQYNHQQNNNDRNYHTENKRDDQYANSPNGNYDRDDKHRGTFNKGNYNSARAREFQIEKINRDFDFRIQAIQHNRYLRRREKKAAIRNAESERSSQLQMVNEKFNHHNNWNR